jgi:hypothetical protein
MGSVIRVAAAGLVLSLGLVEPAVGAVCPDDSVASGTACIDKYEASVWHVPRHQQGLIEKIKKGTVRLADLVAAGAVQLGLASGDLAASGCPATGNGCVEVFAVSIPGVEPARFMNWFQAAAAARNSLKRLPTNQEWQVAALGTPDPGTADDSSTTCATNSFLSATGSRSGCVSDVGAFDMVGNLQEYVAEWVPRSPAGCSLIPNNNWGAFSDDFACLVGAATTGPPGAIIRGGSFISGAYAGVFAVVAGAGPEEPGLTWGFRCAR